MGILSLLRIAYSTQPKDNASMFSAKLESKLGVAFYVMVRHMIVEGNLEVKKF